MTLSKRETKYSSHIAFLLASPRSLKSEGSEGYAHRKLRNMGGIYLSIIISDPPHDELVDANLGRFLTWS